MAVTRVTASLSDETKELQGNNDVYSGDVRAPDNHGDYGVTLGIYDDAGNVSVVNNSDIPALSVEVTLWRTPKTDWQSADRFNIEDYNRIKNNLVYLHEKAVSLWKPFEIEDAGEDIKSYTAYWQAEKFNIFERNLDKINSNIFTQNYGFAQQFYENGPFIRWDELNRIESAILSMNEILERQKLGLRRIPFRLGAFKEVRI